MKRSEPPKELQNKERNSTKLEQCGWCEYASGSHRYSYCISGSCQLLKDYSDNREVVWDTKCRLNGSSRSELASLIDYHKWEIENAKQEIKIHNGYIKELDKIKKKARYVPPLPDNRSAEHFNIDNNIMVFIEEKNKWFTGKVKMGYRHHDGCVSYKLDGFGPQQANDKNFPFEGGYYGCGVAIPHILLELEYDWFCENQKEYELWCKKAYSKNFNGKVAKI